MRAPLFLLATLSLLPNGGLLAGGLVATGPVIELSASPLPGRLAPGPDGRGLGEELSLRADLLASLAALAPEETLLVADWPWAPEERVVVALTRHETYAPDARLFAVDAQGTRLVPRSPLRFFWGPTDRGGTNRLLVELDPESGRLAARSLRDEGVYRLEPVPGDSQAPRFRLVEEPADGLEATGWSCTQQAPPLDRTGGRAPIDLFRHAATSPELISTLHTATIAVDTDNELLAQKFSDNATSATTYLAQLFAAMNVVYERDVLVRLLQGTTFLRLSSTPDPYTQTGSPASFAQLNEVTNYWAGGCGGGTQPSCAGVQRALTMMLSGKSSSTNSSSGIAWLDALCSSSIGYSFSQVFKFVGATGSSDAFVVGHELGHNFGSPHTHCYSPVIDSCYAAEPGCYAGATSCPAPTTINGVPNVRGTLMSYCHILGGCSAAQVFHSRTVNEQVGPLIQASVGTCIFPNDSFAAGFRDGFESGGLVPPWSGKRP